MLQMRQRCERCGRSLLAEDEASICCFECTFCRACATGPLDGTCPNCSGELVPRPRPAPGYAWAWKSPGPVRSLIGWASAATGSVKAFARQRRPIGR